VGQKQPNPWGLYDMHGNMQELVWDWWGDYTPEPLTDPIGPPEGAERVCRGGSMLSPAEFCRSAARQKCSPGSRYNAVGFRLARSL
jgi:formylglycine-generating enzyme